MKNWLKKFDDAMVAAAFAEAGEFETARETLKEKRKILLALRGEKGDIHSFRYALNTCKRIRAELEIIYVTEIEKGLIKQLKSQLTKEGIAYEFIRKKGSLEEAVRNHTDMKRDILFVVVEVSEGIDIHSKKTERIIENARKNLKCPLVVVSQGNNAFAT